MSGIDIGGNGRRGNSGTVLVSSGDNDAASMTESGVRHVLRQEISGSTDEAIRVASEKALQYALKQTPEEDTNNPTRKPNFTLLCIIGVLASYGVVETYKAITKEPAVKPQTTNTTPQIESAKGSLQADFISRMTFEAAPAPQAQPAQNKKQAAPALKP